MRVLALDIGSKNTGVAITDLKQIIAFPLKKIVCLKFNGTLLFKQLKLLLKEYWDEIDTLIIGQPFNQHNQLNLKVSKCIDQTQKVFKSWTNWKIIFVDENLTSVWSTKTLSNFNYSKKNIEKYHDSFAALKILDNYFETQNKQIILALK